jgi:hypothetical protein
VRLGSFFTALVYLSAEAAGVLEARPALSAADLAATPGSAPTTAPRRASSTAAGRGVTIAHALNVLIDPQQIAALPLAGGRPVRHVQAAVMRGQRAPAPLAVVDALREVGARRGQRSAASSA